MSDNRLGLDFIAEKTTSGLLLRKPIPRQERVLKKENEILKKENIHDPLTGILNDRGLYRKAQENLNILSRSNSNLNYSVIALDMIGLKKFNDLGGHSYGSQKLQEAADVLLKSSERSSDILSRPSGDEFVIVAFDSDEEQTLQFIEKIKTNLPTDIHFNICYKNFKNSDAIDTRMSINSVLDRIDDAKKRGPVDHTGRSIGTGVVMNLNYNG